MWINYNVSPVSAHQICVCEHEGTGWGKRHDEILIYCKLIILLADWPTVVLVSGDGWLWTKAPVEQTEMGGMGKETPLYEQDSAHGTTFIQSQ